MERESSTTKKHKERPELRDGRPPSPVSYVINTKRIWPNYPEESIVDFLEKSRAEVKKRRNEGNLDLTEARVYEAQYRAADYFYGRGSRTIEEEKPDNPLVDILALITYSGRPEWIDERLSDLQLAIEGKPAPESLVAPSLIWEKPEQRIFFDNGWQRREFRTIAKFGGNLATTIRGIHVLAEAAKHHPIIIHSTLEQYKERFPKEKGAVPGMAIGLLEIMKNLNLLYDPRFHTLSSQLREITLEGVEDYHTLQQKYSYTIVEDRPFWFMGEAGLAEKRKSLSYVKKGSGDEETDVKRFYRFTLPFPRHWQTAIKRRANIKKELRKLTLFNSLAKSVTNFSEDEAVESIKEDRIKKADLTEELRMLETKQIHSLRSIWTEFLEGEVEENTRLTEGEAEFLEESLRLIFAHFEKDAMLSQKTKTNITENSGYYALDVKNLADNPLFSWVLALRNPYVAEGLKRAIEKEDGSIESFYLFLKLMIYEVARTSFSSKEKDFLFDPNYRQKIDTEGLMRLFGQLRSNASKFIPDVGDLSVMILSRKDKDIEDLVGEENLQELRKKLRDIAYRKILGFIRIDKAYKLTDEDKKLLERVATLLSYGAVATIAISLLTRGVNSLLDRRDAKLEEEERAETQELVEVEIERQRQVEAEVRKEILRDEVLDKLVGFLRRIEGEGSFGEAGIAERLDKISRQLGFPERLDDRIPDAISPEELGNRGQREIERLTSYGKIYHLPEGMEGIEGLEIGYFPWDINVDHGPGYPDKDIYLLFRNTDIEPLSNVDVVQSIDEAELEFEDNQLAYMLNGVNPRVYTPLGYEVSRIIQEGGKLPYISKWGEIYYDYDGDRNIPERVMLVLEPRSLEPLSPRVSRLPGVKTQRRYLPYVYREQINVLSNRLSGDPELQEIHRAFVSEMLSLTDGTQFLSYDEYAEKYSQIALKYTQAFAEYTTSNRYYALGFQVDKDSPGEFKSLVSIADNPDEGYFCSVASFAFRDFMNSVGIATANQPGIALYNYQGYLWGKQAHQNNVIFLPNGEILYVDMTPNMTSKTPRQDVAALTGGVVSMEDIRRAVEEFERGFEEDGDAAPTDGETIVKELIEAGEIARVMNENDHAIPNQKQEEMLQEMLESSRGALSEVLQVEEDTFNSLEPQSERTREILASGEAQAVKRIESNTLRLKEDLARTSDMLESHTSGERIFENIRLLEEILKDSEYLREAEKGQKAADLQVIEENARELILNLDIRGQGELERYRQDLAVRSSFRRDFLLEMQSGKDLLEEREEEQRRIEEYFLRRIRAGQMERYNTEKVTINDIQKLDVMLEYADIHRRIVIIQGLQEMSENTEPDVGGQEERDAQGGHEKEEIKFLEDAFDVKRHLENSFYYEEIMDEEDREILQRLPNTAIRLEKMISGEEDLDQEKKLSMLQGMVEEITLIQIRTEQILKHEDLMREYRLDEIEKAERRWYENKLHEIELEERKKETQRKLARFATSAGIGMVPLAIGYYGLSQISDKRKRKEILERIERSLSQERSFRGIEKDIVVSSVGHLSVLSYDDEFPEKAASVLNLIQNFSRERHEKGVDWFRNEGLGLLVKKDPKIAFTAMQETLREGGDPAASEIKRSFPTEVVNSLEKGKAVIPFDFEVIHSIASILYNNNFLRLARDVFSRLGVESFNQESSLKYKVQDVLDVLKDKYASEDTPDEVKPIFNAIYQLLSLHDSSRN